MNTQLLKPRLITRRVRPCYRVDFRSSPASVDAVSSKRIAEPRVRRAARKKRDRLNLRCLSSFMKPYTDNGVIIRGFSYFDNHWMYSITLLSGSLM